LYIPGNQPKLMLNAGLHHPDGMILDLEDSVPAAEKDAARIMVRNALRTVNLMGAERMVRINQLPDGLDDLHYIVPHNLHLVLIPKCESGNDVKQVDKAIVSILKKEGIKKRVYMMPIIESALGVENAFDIAVASKNVAALAIGLEDYTADIGTQRSEDGIESFYARSRVVNAARAAGVQPIDTVHSDFRNLDGLRLAALEAKALGFDGKGCIHPSQIRIVNEAFAPEKKELDKAMDIVMVFEAAEKKGIAAVSLGSKMIDPPVVKRALRTVDLALKNGMIKKNWRTGYDQ